MKRNCFKKYMSLMKKSKTYMIESDILYTYIYNPCMMLRVTNATYATYFTASDPAAFPEIEDYSKTYCFNKKGRKHVMSLADCIHVIGRFDFGKLYPCRETGVYINTGSYICECFAGPGLNDTGIVLTVNKEFTDAMHDIFPDYCNIQSAGNEYKPLYYIDSNSDALAVVLPVRYIGHDNIKNCLADSYA